MHKKINSFLDRNIITILIVFILINSIFFSYLYYSGEPPQECDLIYNNHSPYWENGEWSHIEVIPTEYNSTTDPLIIEHNGTLHLFYSIVSFSTYEPPDDIKEVHEYKIYDIIHRTYDGHSWSNESAFTPLDDNVTEVMLGSFTFNHQMYLIIREKRIENYTTFEWNTSYKMISYNGITWTEHSYPQYYSGMHIVDWKGVIWNFWKPKWYVGYNNYSYAVYDGSNWSEPYNFTFPSNSSSGAVFKVINNKLYCVWVDWSAPNDQKIYLGVFDGTNWSEFTELTLPDEEVIDWGLDMVSFNGKIFITWESAYWRNTTGGSHIVFRSYDNGTLGDFTRLSADENNTNEWAKLYLFHDKLYVIWESGFRNKDLLIRSYDGVNWSDIYEISDLTHSGGWHSQPIILNDRLIIFWEGRYDDNEEMMIRSFSDSN